MNLRGLLGSADLLRGGRGLLAIGLAALLAGCAPQAVQREKPEIRREAGKIPTIVVMPLDVELAQLTAGGIAEPHAEWTEAAHKHMRAALEAEARSRNLKLTYFDGERGSAEDRETSLELVKLHRAVGGSILVHQYLPGFGLPSKEGKFDWSLGPSVAAISRSHEADYALFLYVRDSYSTAGRMAVIRRRYADGGGRSQADRRWALPRWWISKQAISSGSTDWRAPRAIFARRKRPRRP